MTPCPFSCCRTQIHHTSPLSLSYVIGKYRHDFRSQWYKYNFSARTHHIYSSVLAIVDLVVSDNGTTICPDLDSCQGVAVDVISFDEASAIAEYINTTLVAVKNGVAPTSATKHTLGRTSVSFAALYSTGGLHWPYGRIAVRCDPHPSKVICKDLIFNELAATLFVHIDATSLTVMDLAANHSWIGVRLHLKAGYTVPVDVAAFEIALAKDRKTKQHF